MKFALNGKDVSVKAKDDTPLLYVLRNELGLVGTRFGCGTGQCGACFVLVDGRAMASCDLPASFVADKNVTTVESFDGKHPVQKALVAEQAAQCGYCVNGMIMESAAFLARTRKPSEAQVKDALANNLCRCGTHARIVKAVMRAASA